MSTVAIQKTEARCRTWAVAQKKLGGAVPENSGGAPPAQRAGALPAAAEAATFLQALAGPPAAAARRE